MMMIFAWGAFVVLMRLSLGEIILMKKSSKLPSYAKKDGRITRVKTMARGTLF
jgi:hypothetical protein